METCMPPSPQKDHPNAIVSPWETMALMAALEGNRLFGSLFGIPLVNPFRNFGRRCMLQWC